VKEVTESTEPDEANEVERELIVNAQHDREPDWTQEKDERGLTDGPPQIVCQAEGPEAKVKKKVTRMAAEVDVPPIASAGEFKSTDTSSPCQIAYVKRSNTRRRCR